jgi:hypothetical protein
MTQSLPDYIVAYLNKYSLKEYEIEWQIKSGIKNAIVIPSIAEYENIKILLSSLIRNDSKYFDSSLVLFAINNSHNSNPEVKANNKKTLDFLRSIIFNNSNSEYVNDLKRSGLMVGLIDAASKDKELDEKHSGVGLARKIGMDLALTIFDYRQMSKKLIICLDADCTIKQNYLTTIVSDFNKYNYSAAVIDFAHTIDGNDKESSAIIPYETFIRYYVEGLKYSGSQYAFHTIGSATVCDVDAYIKSGGMNKRKAAEDFYFLEKIAKNYKISKLDSTTVYPSNRSSWRVPFGTGQRVARFINNTHNEYQLFDPAVLEQWDNIFENSKSAKQLLHQKKIWFDGFKTLKLIHHLRDNAFPNINMFDALDMFFLKLKINNTINRNRKDIPELEIQKQYLKLLREID